MRRLHTAGPLASCCWRRAASARAEEEIIELDEMTITGQAMTETLSAKTLDEAGLGTAKETASDSTDLLKDSFRVSVFTPAAAFPTCQWCVAWLMIA